MMKVKKIPQRKCLGCNEMKDKKALLRVVRLERALEKPIGEDVLKQLLEDFEHGRQ